ncbi:MAG: hypothetical protein ABJE10_00460 [bacterium]
MPDDNKFDDFLRREAKDYNASVTPPTDAIWSRIESDVADAIRPRAIRRITPRRAWIAIGVGIAAAMVIGVSVGRWTAQPVVSVATAPVRRDAMNDSVRTAAHARASTMEHLAETEIFLTEFRADLKSGHTDAELRDRSRELLARTRLLLGASTDRSPATERLLEDLELLLAEISALPKSRPSMDVQLLDETMRQGNILPRIRTTLPAQSAGT